MFCLPFFTILFVRLFVIRFFIVITLLSILICQSSDLKRVHCFKSIKSISNQPRKKIAYRKKATQQNKNDDDVDITDNDEVVNKNDAISATKIPNTVWLWNTVGVSARRDFNHALCLRSKNTKCDDCADNQRHVKINMLFSKMVLCP